MKIKEMFTKDKIITSILMFKQILPTSAMTIMLKPVKRTCIVDLEASIGLTQM